VRVPPARGSGQGPARVQTAVHARPRAQHQQDTAKTLHSASAKSGAKIEATIHSTVEYCERSNS
jgi:hypothetical protein